MYNIDKLTFRRLIRMSYASWVTCSILLAGMDCVKTRSNGNMQKHTSQPIWLSSWPSWWFAFHIKLSSCDQGLPPVPSSFHPFRRVKVTVHPLCAGQNHPKSLDHQRVLSIELVNESSCCWLLGRRNCNHSHSRPIKETSGWVQRRRKISQLQGHRWSQMPNN